jgi:Domain of unknown function (DUF397)
MNNEAVQALGPAHWSRSSHSKGENTCVEVAVAAGWVGVRDSTLGADSPVLAVGPLQWRALLTGIRAGERTG